MLEGQKVQTIPRERLLSLIGEGTGVAKLVEHCCLSSTALNLRNSFEILWISVIATTARIAAMIVTAATVHNVALSMCSLLRAFTLREKPARPQVAGERQRLVSTHRRLSMEIVAGGRVGLAGPGQLVFHSRAVRAGSPDSRSWRHRAGGATPYPSLSPGAGVEPRAYFPIGSS